MFLFPIRRSAWVALLSCTACAWFVPTPSAAQVSVEVDCPGLSTASVDELVAVVLTRHVSSIAGVVSVQTESQPGRVLANITLSPGLKQPKRAVHALRDALSSVSDLPAECRAPNVRQVMGESVVVQIVGDPAVGARVGEGMRGMFGVVHVQVSGGAPDQVVVQLDPARMQAMNVGVDRVVAAVRTARAPSVRDLPDVVVRDGLRVADLALIVVEPSAFASARVDGKQAVELTIVTTEVAVLRDRLSKLPAELPPDVHFRGPVASTEWVLQLLAPPGAHLDEALIRLGRLPGARVVVQTEANRGHVRMEGAERSAEAMRAARELAGVSAWWEGPGMHERTVLVVGEHAVAERTASALCTLATSSGQIEACLPRVPRAPTLEIVPDRQQLGRLGLTVAQVTRAARAVYGIHAATVRSGDDDIDVIVRLGSGEDLARTPEALRHVRLGGVPLRAVVKVTVEQELQERIRVDGLPAVPVRLVATTSAAIDAVLDDVVLPDGVTLRR